MALDSRYTWRPAYAEDAPQLELLMNAAIGQLLAPYLPPDEVTASFAIMGLDRQLIEDGTYMVIEHEKHIIASGGWSARATLFGGAGVTVAVKVSDWPTFTLEAEVASVTVVVSAATV